MATCCFRRSSPPTSPPITDSWRDFGHGDVLKEDIVEDFARARHSGRRARFGHYVDSIRPASHPVLHYLHVMLPHPPWRYLPSGASYGERPDIPGLDGLNWGSDAWLVAQAYQRHLLQLGLADHLLGTLIQKLKETGHWDKSLVIVVADHGASFRAEESRRHLSASNVADIAGVPLFVKRPYQSAAFSSEHQVSTIDILPTIADVVGIGE